MFKKIQEKRESLTAKYMNSTAFQKGFTLMELLIVIAILLILVIITVVSFNVFGRVDGTELNSKSKHVENAVLQTALADAEAPAREIPGKDAYNKANNSPAQYGGIDATAFTAFFDKDAEKEKLGSHVMTQVATAAGISLDELKTLLVEVDTDEVQKNVAGDAKASNYLVVLRKSQLNAVNSKALDDKGYTDTLAGKVFSKDTIKDSDGYYYNGTHKTKVALPATP